MRVKFPESAKQSTMRARAQIEYATVLQRMAKTQEANKLLDVRGLYRLHVQEWQPEPNRKLMGGSIYDDYLYTVDGELYRGANFTTRRGKIRAQQGLTTGYMTPLFFLGHNMNNRRR